MGLAPSHSRVEQAYRQGQGPTDVRMRIKWKGRSYTLAQTELGPGDDAICRAQTAAYTGGPGWTLTGLLQTAAQAAVKGGDVATAGTDVLAVLLWTVRRKGGEPDLRLADVFDTITTMDLVEGLEVEAEVDMPEGEGQPPET